MIAKHWSAYSVERYKTPITDTKRTPDRSLSLVPSATNSDPTPKRYRLGTMGGIRRELSQVYRLARSGKLELQDATKLAFILSTLSKISESELIEDRLMRLESNMEERENDNKY